MKERRRKPRFAYSDKVLVKFVWVSGHPEMSGTSLLASSRDVSPEGIRLRLERCVAPEAKLHLCIAANHPEGLFMMRGLARWCHPCEDGEDFFVGVEFTSPADDLGNWASFVEQLRDVQTHAGQDGP